MAEVSANVLLNEVIKWDGYLEKESNYRLDELTTNAGDGNYTCFARDYDKLMNTKKNGYAWCAMYASMMFVYAFGFEKAKSIIGGNLFCGCTGWYNALKKKNQISSTPQKGDLIFFKNKLGAICHVGLVVEVDNSKVYTIEGNTSSTSGVVANGGCVRQKSYKLNYNRIKGYGRPLYEVKDKTENISNKGVKTVTVQLPLLQKGSKGKAVETLQILLNVKGYKGKDGKTLTVDQDFGTNVEYAFVNYQKDHPECGKADGKVGTLGWKSLLGAV